MGEHFYIASSFPGTISSYEEGYQQAQNYINSSLCQPVYTRIIIYFQIIQVSRIHLFISPVERLAEVFKSGIMIRKKLLFLSTVQCPNFINSQLFLFSLLTETCVYSCQQSVFISCRRESCTLLCKMHYHQNNPITSRCGIFATECDN